MRSERLAPWGAALSVGFAIFLFGLSIVYTFNHQNHTNARICQSAVDNREGLRDTWNAARTLLLATQTPAQRERTDEFFDGVLRPIPPLECVNNRPVPKEG